METVELNSKHIKNFYMDSCYRVSQRFTLTLVKSDKMPEDAQVIPVSFELLNIPEVDKTLESIAFNTSAQLKLRTKLKFHRRSHMFVGYNAARYHAIMKYALLPAKNNPLGQINGFLWGPRGHKSRISECVIVSFKDGWQTRAQGAQSAFQLPDGSWMHLKHVKYLKHSKIQAFSDMAKPQRGHSNSLSVRHHQTLRDLSLMAGAMEPPRRPKLTLKLKLNRTQ
jgi:hypothetical protein